MSEDLITDIEHLDLTNRVQQIEDCPRFVGGFGKVYYGNLRSGSAVLHVAIKRVSLSGDQNLAKTIVNKEMKIWSRLDHPNVLKLCGYALDRGEVPALVSEWMTNGTVLKYLKLNPQVGIFDMVTGIANGLSYLHSKGVVHADLKSENILISPSGAPLLTDFGISRTLIVTHTVTTLGELMGSVRWMAHELIAPYGLVSGLQEHVDATTTTDTKPAVPSKETDVWAFGMVVYELLTKEYPFHSHSTVQVVVAIALGHLPSRPSNLQSRGGIEKSFWNLCTRCWNRDPTSRPAMTAIVREINGCDFGSSLDNRPNADSTEYAEIGGCSKPQNSPSPEKTPPAEITLKDFLRSIGYLDLTNDLEQTEDRPRVIGGSGKVYYGKLHSNRAILQVAIKRVKASLPGDESPTKTIINELKVWSYLDHRNVLRLRGYTLDDGGFPALISDWMTNGTVLQYLIQNPHVDLVDMVKGIADGLVYLHKEGVIHADLKSDHVLISPSGVPLLSDFGISRTQSHTGTNLDRLTGSVRWMAYELIARNVQKNVGNTTTMAKPSPADPSKETDVWAFGMVVYELLAKEYPFARLSPVQTTFAILTGNLPSPPSNTQSHECTEKSLWDLCTRCWNRDPTLRPVMTAIVREIIDVTS